MSRQRLLRAIGGFGCTAGIVVVAHGGQSIGPEPTSPVQLSVLRMIPLTRAIRRAVRRSGVVVCCGTASRQSSPVSHSACPAIRLKCPAQPPGLAQLGNPTGFRCVPGV